MEGKLRYPDWSERRTDDELLLLAALVRDNKILRPDGRLSNAPIYTVPRILKHHLKVLRVIFVTT